MRSNTKEARLQSRTYQFNKLIESGYTQETYKEIDFFVKNDGKYFTLKVYKGTGANHIEYMNYRTEERRAEVIQNYKKSYENGLKWKAEQKEKNKGKSSSHAGAAAAIKAELINNFPGIKFSVTSESFSMGNSVNISWTDGPTSGEVKAISGKYQYGHFDGMTDMYENTNDRDDIPQAKYVSESRSQSETVKAILPTFAAMFHPDQETDYRNNPESVLHRVWAKTSLPADYANLRIEKTDCTCGFYEEFYCLCFDSEATQQTAAAPQYKAVEVIAGEINIVDYSEKAFAVIGSAEDLKLIQSKMYDLGGKYNKYLKCGAGYIFSKKKLDEVTAALSEEIKTAEPEQNIECAEVQNVSLLTIEEDTPQHYSSLEDITAAAQGGKVISLYNLSQLVKHVQ